MSKYKELADTLEWLAEGYWEAEIRKAIAILRSLDAQEPMFWYRPTCNGEMYEGPVHANSVGGKMLRDEKPDEWMPLYAAPVAAQPTREQAQRERMEARQASRAPSPATADFDLPAQSDEVAAQPPFEKGSWQHAVDDQLVSFGRTSQEFDSPHDAVRWLIEQEVQLDIARADLAAQPQQAKPLSDAEILAIVSAGPALDTAEDEWLHITRAIIAAFCQKNGIKEHE